MPAFVRVVDASDDRQTEHLCSEDWAPLPVEYIKSSVSSASQQRNLGAADCSTEIIVFSDDDVEFPPETLQTLLSVFEQDTQGQIGGVAGSINGLQHRAPGRLLRLYYRLQAGYSHEHYGGRFFGPAINIIPTDRPEDPQLYPSQWLNSTLVAYRTDLFLRERFPDFSGYSFQEDVNLSARIGRTHQLYFHRGARYVHKASPGAYKRDTRGLAEMQLTNRWYNATALLGLRGPKRLGKFALSLAFESALLLLRRPAGWRDTLLGLWRAMLKLVLGRQKNDDRNLSMIKRGLEVITRGYHGLMSRLQNSYYKALGVRLEGYVWMRSVEIPRNWGDVTLGANTSLDRGVTILCSGDPKAGKFVLGSGTYVNRWTMFEAYVGLHIGKNCLIGPHCYFSDSNHGINAGSAVRSQGMTSAPIIIEDDVWIGTHSVILPGVHIGQGAVIAAGSVVTSDVPANAVYAGVPARFLRNRRPASEEKVSK